MNVYRACDIRGHAVEELSPHMYRNWGGNLGRKIGPGSTFVVGGDVRPSTGPFLAALIEGLHRAGMKVVDLGIAPTPMVHFARWHLGAMGCAIVTASHSPPAINGLKWMVGRLPPTEADVLDMQQGSKETVLAKDESSSGAYQKLDIDAEYSTWLQQVWDGRGLASGSPIVLDPGNGSWAGRCLPCLEKVFPHLCFRVLHDRPDGTFPERNPDCARPEYLGRLAGLVGRLQADLGIAFDGDGDRVAFVDNEGKVLNTEEAIWVLLRSFGDELCGQTFIGDIKLSQCIAERARQLGAVTQVQRSGHGFIRTSMIRTGARFGAELSGHYFYSELQGGDDALFTACRMIDYLAKNRISLAALRRECPQITMTPDLRLPVAEEKQDEVLGRLGQYFGQYPQSFIDGVRIEFPQGWGLFRKSVTEAVISCRFEASDGKSLGQIVGKVCRVLGELGSDLWQQYAGEQKGQ